MLHKNDRLSHSFLAKFTHKTKMFYIIAIPMLKASNISSISNRRALLHMKTAHKTDSVLLR